MTKFARRLFAFSEFVPSSPGVRSEFVLSLLGVCSAFVRSSFGVRSEFVRSSFGVCSELVHVWPKPKNVPMQDLLQVTAFFVKTFNCKPRI